MGPQGKRKYQYKMGKDILYKREIRILKSFLKNNKEGPRNLVALKKGQSS